MQKLLFLFLVLSSAAANLGDREPIQPLPLDFPHDAQKAALGKTLFQDRRLSGDGTVSCASCHDVTRGGTDGLPVSIGAGGSRGVMNAPTVFNTAFNFRQFWDGRAHTLLEQMDGPISNPVEMDSSWTAAQKKIEADEGYRTSFNRLYGGLTVEAMKDAIHQFERSLVTANAPFDRYLRGDPDAITAEQKRGYEKFKSYGCVSCHQGMNVGGNMFQTMGVMGNYFADRGKETKADLGRFNVTGRAEDKHVFRVPSLRNVAKTAPYFHDGSAKTLNEAVRIMARYQLGQEISRQDAAAIVKFLESLSGEVPASVRGSK